jgi:hypothetical protein
MINIKCRTLDVYTSLIVSTYQKVSGMGQVELKLQQDNKHVLVKLKPDGYYWDYFLINILYKKE